MKELIIHENCQNNLCSIKSIENNYSDRNYMESIIYSLLNMTHDRFYVEASRPNYEITSLEESLKHIMLDNKTFKFTNFGISFSDNRVSKELIEILPLIWFGYEHIAICFFIRNEIQFDIKRKPWYEITENQQSYVLFKGIEEDVIWIGKSKELTFDVLKTI